MTKQNVRCDACGCAFVPEPKTQREGEIEYSFFNCDYCGKAYIVSVTDAALRRSIRKYRSLAEKLKRKARYLSYRTKNKNKDFTLVCQNCLGGLIYSVLDLPFTSPTISLRNTTRVKS